MKRSRLISLKEKMSQGSPEPWACFETTGVDDNGRIEFAMSWNKAFVQNLKKQGYTATTDEELVQLFFISTRMLPEEMLEDENTVNPEATPRLSSEANILKR